MRTFDQNGHSGDDILSTMQTVPLSKPVALTFLDFRIRLNLMARRTQIVAVFEGGGNRKAA
jgi:hypothetical protein